MLLMWLLVGLEVLRLGLGVDNLLLGGEKLEGRLLNTHALMSGHRMELSL